MDQGKELALLQNRLKELAQRSYAQNCFLFTDFLGLSEQDVFRKMEPELQYAGVTVFGGKALTERNVIRFGSEKELGYEAEFPIACIHIRPLMEKFADKLSHRDFLGALMNLGVERSTLGDILAGEHEAYLFCLDTIAAYICENLTQVKHTQVTCSVVTDPVEMPVEKPETLLIQVASNRADAVLAKVYDLSRSESIALFQSGKVFVNGRLLESNAYTLKPEDVLSTRGYGKMVVQGERGLTKKGKLNLAIAVYR